MAGRPQSVSDEEIFDAVTSTISADGPHRLTVAAVASRLGVTAPAVRQRFGSKRNLLVAYAEHQAAIAATTLPDAVGLHEAPIEALISGLVGCAAELGDRSSLANHLALLHLDLTDPDLSAHARLHSRGMRMAIARLLQLAAQRGQLNPGVDIDDLADSVHTTYNGALVTWAVDGTGPLGPWLGHRITRSLRPHATTIDAEAPSPPNSEILLRHRP